MCYSSTYCLYGSVLYSISLFVCLHVYAYVAYMCMRMPSSPRSIVEDLSGRAISYFVPDVVWGLAIWRHNNIQKKSCGVGYSTYSQPRKTERKKKTQTKQKTTVRAGSAPSGAVAHILSSYKFLKRFDGDNRCVQ